MMLTLGAWRQTGEAMRAMGPLVDEHRVMWEAARVAALAIWAVIVFGRRHGRNKTA